MITQQPTWLYKTIDIPNVNDIQKEFQMVLDCYPLEMAGVPGYDLIIGNKELIAQHCPLFVNLLKNLNLLDRWDYTAWSMSTIPGENIIIHTDYDWRDRSFALNIPILNCHDSYTAWYKPRPGTGVKHLRQHEELKDYPLPEKWQDHYPGQQWRAEDIEGEIDRMAASQPAFVNHSIPHRPVTYHNDTRILISTRFLPELFDYDFDRLQFTIDR
jgi:hypothetical protein